MIPHKTRRHDKTLLAWHQLRASKLPLFAQMTSWQCKTNITLSLSDFLLLAMLAVSHSDTRMLATASNIAIAV